MHYIIYVPIVGRGTKSTGIKSTKERNQPRNKVNPGRKSTREENQNTSYKKPNTSKKIQATKTFAACKDPQIYIC